MAKTIFDVARLAGVGIGTVSRAINNSPQIRPETKKRVMQAIEELGYTPHTTAQRLARRRTGIIAAIMPSYSGHFYQELQRGMQQELSEHHHDLILIFVDDPAKKDAYLTRVLQEKRSDGVLVISMDIDAEHIRSFSAAGLPLVLVDRAHEGVDSIQVENQQGAYMATSHLIALGHRRLGIITGWRSSTPARQRLTGFKNALNDANLPYNSRLYISADMLGKGPEYRQNDGFNEAVGFAATERLLSRSQPPPTAIFASADIHVIGAMKAAQKAGLKVPEDLSIIGFDDIELSSYLSITTVQQPMYEIGRLAVDLIMSKIDKKTSSIHQIKLSTKLIERGTTQACKQPSATTA